MNEPSNQWQLEIIGNPSNYRLFTQLKNHSEDIIFIHPAISLFFDKRNRDSSGNFGSYS